MRSPDRTLAGLAQHCLDRDGNTESVERCHDRLGAHNAILLEGAQGLAHGLGVREMQAQQMHFVVAEVGAEFNPGDDPHAQPPAGLDRLG